MKVAEYAVDLDLAYPTGAFRGDATVTVDRLPSPLELDCEGLDVVEVQVDGRPVSFRLDPAREKLVVAAGSDGGRAVRVRFSGAASRTTLTGLYVSESGERPVLTTMMAPMSCHRLFPCFDTPDRKAVFRLRVTTEPTVEVISNAPVERTEPVGDRRRWCFAPSPPMSTYLLYLGVGPFETLEQDGHGVRCIAATLPGKSARSRTILDLAGPIVHAYGEYYGQPYPLPKLHLVAVPDLWAGAMENWGAIAFPELGLLVDEETSPAIRRWAVETVAHEIAHQWFGNLVTMESYADLWLNESFATFVAAKIEERLGLRSHPWEEFFIRTRPAYFGDSLESTHPIRIDASDPRTIAESTDEITYFKGASVVRMVEAYLGEAPFRRGVAAYLERFRYGNARGEDLWAELARVSGEPIDEVLPAWVRRPGIPVVRVVPGGAGLRLTQGRYRLSGDRPDEAPWPIPLTVEVGGRTRRWLFREPSADLPWTPGESLRVNPGRAAFVRVAYDRRLWPQLLHDLDGWGVGERWALLNDTAAFLFSGEAELADYLELLRRARAWTEYPCVEEALQGIDWLRPYVGDRPEFRQETLAFAHTHLERLTLEARANEPDTDAVLRESVLVDLAQQDDDLARELADRFSDVDRLPPAQRAAVGIAYARVRPDEAVAPLEARLRSTESEDVAQMAAWALGMLPTPSLLDEALGHVLEPGVRSSAGSILVVAAASNPTGRPRVWPWLVEHLRELEERHRGSWTLARLLERVLPLAGLGREDEVAAYFARESFPEAAHGIRKSLEVLRIGRAFLDRSAAT